MEIELRPSWHPRFSSATDPKTSQRRLDNPYDFVRVELREALSRRILVVPVLLDGASMPAPEHLPEDMRGLVRRQAEFVEHRTFDADVERLVKRLQIGRSATPLVSNAMSSQGLTEKDRRRAYDSAKAIAIRDTREPVREEKVNQVEKKQEETEPRFGNASGIEPHIVPPNTRPMKDASPFWRRRNWMLAAGLILLVIGVLIYRAQQPVQQAPIVAQNQTPTNIAPKEPPVQARGATDSVPQEPAQQVPAAPRAQTPTDNRPQEPSRPAPAAQAAPLAADLPPLVYSSWTKFCSTPDQNGQDANTSKTCFTARDGRTEAGGVPVVAAALIDPTVSPRRF